MLQDIAAAIIPGFILSFMIGPVFFVLLETSVVKGFKAALVFDLGVVLADIIFILIAYFSSYRLIESIKEDSQRLLKITGELLDISQLETGNIHLSIEKSNPYQIVNYAIEAVKVQAEQKQIELIIEAENDLPEVKADSEKTGWVLINFLTNAITYSSNQSKIIVKLKQEKNQVIFQVIDNGKGIDMRYQSKVFDKYFQIPGSNKSGTGLGLAISKEFIEAQNGTISVESELGLGSTFNIGLNIV